MKHTWSPWLAMMILHAGNLAAENQPPPLPAPPTNPAGRLSVPSTPAKTEKEIPWEIPRPAHAAKPPAVSSPPGFRSPSSRNSKSAAPERPPAQAEYFLPDRENKPPITPENANLNLPSELEITASDTGEKITLPAGTYRQILQLPLDSPLMKDTDQVRRSQARSIEVPTESYRYAEPEKKPVWVRYESLEKIKIGEAERRGGIDLPSHGPQGLGPRIWYAKSEMADLASSIFYFVFGGLGYSTANLLGWSAGNTREISDTFEYRLIRR